MSDHEVLTIATRGGFIPTRVLVGGHGYPLLWLHGGTRLHGWEPQFELLAQHFTVYAPMQPELDGTPGREHLADFWDLTLHYCDLLDALVLDSPYVAGHDSGGMLAAELAATAPDRVAKLVLVSPFGLSSRHIYRISAPTLLVWGRQDKIVPPTFAAEFRRHLPAAKLALFDRAGHQPHLEDPGAFGEEVIRFLTEA